MKRTIRFSAVALAILAVAASHPIDKSDRKTLEKLGQGGVSEVLMAKHIESKIQNEAVKDFAQRMIKDHGKAGADLEKIADAKGVKIPMSLDKEHKDFEAKLAKEPLGATYDRTYIAQMVKDHEQDSKDFEQAQKSVKDPELKAWVDTNLPVIKEHLAMARDIHAKLK